MTGSASDLPDWQPHIRNKPRREALAKRFRDPNDPFKIVIVRDMWLTGSDCPSLRTLYLDKPMRGHGLMQAIARVNWVFRDKPDGLGVDYLGLAHELKAAAEAPALGSTKRPLRTAGRPRFVLCMQTPTALPCAPIGVSGMTMSFAGLLANDRSNGRS